MGFVVRPEALDDYAKLVERNGINLSLANVHLAGESRLENTEGLWIQHLLDAHTQTVDRMLTSLAQGFHHLGASADELARTAAHYRSVDQTEAGNLDATYPASPRPPVGAPGPVSTQRPGEQGPTEAVAGDDIRNPLAHLTEPGDPPDFSDPMALFNTLGDYLSPTWWINQVLNDTIGVNPMEYVNQLVIGDWKGFARCGTMWAQLAGAADDIGDNLDNGLRWLAADWQGKAGDAAVHYFDYAGKAMHSHADVFRVLHEKYVEIAQDVWLCSKTLADIIKAIMAAALVAAHGVTEVVRELVAAVDRGVAVDLVLESTLEHGGRLRQGAGTGAFEALADRATFWHWPAENRRNGMAALHAKVLVADAEVALLTSANFTDRGLADNIEVGILLRDPDEAGRLDRHFRMLMRPEARCLTRLER